MNIVLASASPRRRELLQTAGVRFSVRVSQADEQIAPGTPPHEAVMQLARQKAQAVAQACPDDLVIGADTVLRRLSGQTHTVYTGVCLLRAGTAETFFEQTQVTFYPLTDAEIAAYVATGEPMDKAGAYGIQGRGCTLVREIRGDYFNVVGLPVAALYRRLSGFNG